MRVVLGFDGGGTKTECVAMDVSATIVARGRGPASNPTRIGFEPAAAGVKQAAANTLAVLGKPAEVVAICAGLAGTAKPENHARMLALLQAEFPDIPIDLRTDLDLALAAMPDGPAVVLVVGTGSAAIGRDAAGRRLREGGYGPGVSDEGSAYDIGHAAVEASRTEPKSDTSAELSRQILRHLGCSIWPDVDAKIAASHPDEVYPRAFPVVAASADAGNTLAQALLSSAAAKLAQMALRLAQALGVAEQAFPLGKTGGTIGRSRFFDEVTDRELRAQLPGVAITRILVDAAETAARVALRNGTSGEGVSR